MLVPWLLADKHLVTVVDTEWFGSGHLPDNENLTVINGDIRSASEMALACKGQQAVIALASISAESMCQKYGEAARSVNVDGAAVLVQAARKANVERFIYASSVAAYGSRDRDATENDELAPATLYGKAKCEAEKIAIEHFPDTTIVRSASVCGYSLHQRFDLTVNKMAHDAVRGHTIVVNGGKQKRCHIHMRDICRAYRTLVDAKAGAIAGQTFNFVAENAAVIDTAAMVAEETNCEIKIGPPTDNRSYTVSGAKAKDMLGFTASGTIRKAVRELVVRLEAGYWKDSATNPAYQNMAHGLS